MKGCNFHFHSLPVFILKIKCIYLPFFANYVYLLKFLSRSTSLQPHQDCVGFPTQILLVLRFFSVFISVKITF